MIEKARARMGHEPFPFLFVLYGQDLKLCLFICIFIQHLILYRTILIEIIIFSVYNKKIGENHFDYLLFNY